MKKTIHTTEQGEKIDLFTLTNKNNVSIQLMSLGATWIDFTVPDKNNVFDNICLSYGSVSEYLKKGYFGSTIGRCANRIAKGEFQLNGKSYFLAINNGKNSLHGGTIGFDKRVWKTVAHDDLSVEFQLFSPNGEEGYPGNLNVSVTYTLTDEDKVKIKYDATCDEDTIVNMTNHSFFNLNGFQSYKVRDVLGHHLELNCDSYIPVDDSLIPMEGRIDKVEDTPFDFRKKMTIGSRIDQVPGGYDHTFVKTKNTGGIDHIATLSDVETGRCLKVYTTEPGVQVYTGNFLDGSRVGKSGHAYQKHYGVCLECQQFPDAINQPGFSSVILRKGESYSQITSYKFEKL